MWDIYYIKQQNIEAMARNITVYEINSFRDIHPEHDDRTDFEVACMIVQARDNSEDEIPTVRHWDGTPFEDCAA